MPTVRLGINRTRVDIPQNMIDEYQRGAITREHLMQHAIRTNQAEVFDFTQRKDSFGKVAAQAAGAELMRLGSNIQQAQADFMGNEERSEELKEQQKRIGEFSSRLFRERPGATITGQVAPFMAVPGGKVAQMGAGAFQGFMEGDTMPERLGGAALGAGLAFTGQALGNRIGNFANRQFGRLFRAAREPAREVLETLGIPMTISQRTGDPLSRFTERLQFVLTNNQPKLDAQKRALTRMVANFLGEDSDSILRATRASINTRLGRMFRDAAHRAGGVVDFDQAARAQASQLLSRADDLQGANSLYRTLIKRLDDNAFNGQMDADQLLQLRSDLSALSASRNVDIEVPEIVKAIDLIDDQIMRVAPDLADDLRLARQQFRVFLAVVRGRSLDPDGIINADTFETSLQAIFPSFRRGSPLPGGARPIGEGIDAFRQVVRPFRTSSTAENLLSVGAAPLIGLGLTGDPEGLGAGVLATGLALSGGGAGGLLGGGAGRGMLMEYLRRRDQQPLPPYRQ